MISLNKNLFWDIDINNLDYEENANFVISRVLSYGDIEDFKTIKNQYGLKKIKEVAKKISFSNKKSLYFWSLVFNLPLNSFKCTKTLLTKKSSAFWRR